MPQILVVDDEMGIRELLSEILTDEGYTVRVAENAGAARRARLESRPDLVLLDIWMPDMDGISLLKEWSASGQLNMPVVVMSGHATIDTAVEATRIGAVDFLEKPIALQKLLSTVKHAMRHVPGSIKVALSLTALGRCAPIREFKKRMEQIASSSRKIHLRGVAGGVAELSARVLHQAAMPWFDLGQCTAPVNQEQLQRLQGGIVFCADLSALSKMQALSLVFIAERLDKFNLTLLFGSSRPLAALENSLDLAYAQQLGEVWINLPELSRCQDDIPEIAALLLTQLVETREVPAHHLSVAAQNRLRQTAWLDDGGGWLSLTAALRNLALGSLEEEISEADVQRILMPAQMNGDNARRVQSELQAWLTLPLREAKDAFEKCYFEHWLQHEKGSITRLSEQSGLERTHLYRKLRQLGISTGRRSDGDSDVPKV
jgi:two-component system, NtrC family, nitrogen regulation response regulator NtrX